MEKKVEEIEAKGDLSIELIGGLMGDQLRQDSNVVPRLEKLEELIKESQDKKMTKKEKRKVGLKESILATTFIGFVASFLFFMWMFETEDVQYLKIILSVWLVFWAIIMLFGFDKGSIMAFGAALIKVATDKSMSTEDKLALMMLIIQEWLNIVAMEKIVLVEEKKKELTKKEKLANLNKELATLEK